MLSADEPRALLVALRAAGCVCFLSDGEFFASPPARAVIWDDDPEEAIDFWCDELAELVQAEQAAGVH
jgi:hypothetical protein